MLNKGIERDIDSLWLRSLQTLDIPEIYNRFDKHLAI